VHRVRTLTGLAVYEICVRETSDIKEPRGAGVTVNARGRVPAVLNTPLNILKVGCDIVRQHTF